MMILGALPMFYLELLIGQYQSEGIISVWKMAPIFKGEQPTDDKPSLLAFRMPETGT